MHIAIERCNLMDYFSRLQPGEEPHPGVFLSRPDVEKGSPEDLGMIELRPGDQTWHIVNSPIAPGVEPHWAINEGGKHARVPLFPYLTQDGTPETLVATGLHFGLAALHLCPRDKPISQMFIVVGNVFTRPDGQAGFQAWLGVAFELE
jgi:hypothetical protein